MIFQKILCFKAYFRQNLVGSDAHQIRKVKILFYMEDGTIQVRAGSFYCQTCFQSIVNRTHSIR